MNSTCYSTKSYASLGDVYVYVTANSRLGSLFRMLESKNLRKSFTINVNKNDESEKSESLVENIAGRNCAFDVASQTKDSEGNYVINFDLPTW